MNSKPKIIFLLASISQPRCLKRIRGFIDKDFEVEIYGFDRGVYNINSSLENHEIHSLGFAPSGSGYLKKLLYARKRIKDLFRKNKNSNVLYYSFSFDISLICKLYNKKYIYEISDLVYGYFRNKFIRESFTSVDRFLISSSFLTVMTSKGFYNFIYPNKLVRNVIIQPNRVDSYFFNDERSKMKMNAENLTFSYIGAFRYPNTVFRFAKVIGEKYPQHSFLFFGDSTLTDQVKELASKYENVEYHGQFRNPEDLSQIYSQVNIVVACYDVETLNERIAEPNKLYESMFFNKPIVVSNDTFLKEQVVDNYKSGYAIDASKDSNIIDFINSIDNISLEQITDNIRQIKIREIVDDKSLRIIDFVNDNI